MSVSPKTKNTFIGLAIFLAGIVIVTGLTLSRNAPERKDRPKIIPLVEVMEIEHSKHPATIQAMGEVIPAQQVSLAPQVAGRITDVSSALIPGGQVKQGDVLASVDRTDYHLAYRQAQANVTQAELNLEEQKGLAKAAQRELQLVEGNLEPTEEGRKLASRETYVKNAEAQLEAAKSALEQARVNLYRTRVRAPFDARIVSKSVEVGQQVTSQTILATLLASDRVWVEVTLPPQQLDWINIPGFNAEEGSPATIRQTVSHQEGVERQAHVLRLLPTLTTQGKLARVLLEIPNPFQAVPLSEGKSSQAGVTNLPLLVGSFVHVTLSGKTIDKVLALPRTALQENNQLHLYTQEGTLALTEVEAVFKDETKVYVRGDFPQGAKIITSRLALPVPGMKLRLMTDSVKNDSSTDEPTKPAMKGKKKGSSGAAPSVPATSKGVQP